MKFLSAIVVGTVYCDTCSQSDFSSTTQFISVECGSEPSFREEVKTDAHGKFKIRLPFSVAKHVEKIKECSVKLISSPEPYCSVAPTSSSSSSLRLISSRKQGTHIFSAGFFRLRPLKCKQISNEKVQQQLLTPLPLPRNPFRAPSVAVPLPPNPFQPPPLTLLPPPLTLPRPPLTLPPNPFLRPPLMLPPNPFQPPPLTLPSNNPLQPPALTLPPNPFQLSPPPPPPPPPYIIALPPFPFQPAHGYHGIPPPSSSSFSSKETSPSP
ncbi:hypothetical protein U1Q18_038880 [Sarracenia purpurea var. burkii]